MADATYFYGAKSRRGFPTPPQVSFPTGDVLSAKRGHVTHLACRNGEEFSLTRPAVASAKEDHSERLNPRATTHLLAQVSDSKFKV
jgi:hypothetical protein